VTLDARLTPARPDLAAEHLRGRVEAARFVKGEAGVVTASQAPVRRVPAPDAPLDTEALMGERVTVYEATEEGWAWGQLTDDGYVGWMPASALGPPGPAPTHKVVALRTLVFPGPSIKLLPLAALPFGARVTVVGTAEHFSLTANGHVPASHLAPLGFVEPDPVAVAERFLGTPYLWGGKSSLGLDCSGLVQLALAACGIACPRDTDLQEHALGAPVATADFSELRRGDLVFWRGHVAIVRDPQTLLHANAFHMAVTQEPIAEAIARIRATEGAPSSVRRLDSTAGRK
jgi:cell wall-associated NlpC family hydrolase